MEDVKYYLRDGDKLFISILNSQHGIKAGIISGQPGVGKTSLAQHIADENNAKLISFLAHHWVSEEDLFVKIDPARVAGIAGGVLNDMQAAYREGVLLRATLKSQKQKVVLLLDEWDKAPERSDALLLEFLQSGIVRGCFGEEWVANQSNMIVIITDNAVRQLSEPLLRRCYRYNMPFLPAQVEADIIRKHSGLSASCIRLIVSMMNEIRTNGASSPSLQEGCRLADGLKLAGSIGDVELLIKGFLCKQTEDFQKLVEKFKSPQDILWGEFKRK